MMHAPRPLLLLAALVVSCGLLADAVQATTYTFLRTPRCGDTDPATVETLHPMCEGEERRVEMPAAPSPTKFEYTQLAAFDTETKEVRVLIDPGLGNAVVDAVPGLMVDGERTVFYSLCLNVHRNGAAPDACHIERLFVDSGERERIIEGGIHLSPREYQPGKLVYQWHGEQGFRPAGLKTLSFQLAIHDIETGAGEIIGHQSVGSALHPFPLTNGTIAFNSLENQGVRSHSLWGIWTQFPDGRHWSPLWSAFRTESAGTTKTRHFAEQLGSKRIVVAKYYEDFTGGLGTLFEMAPAERDVGRPVFGSWNRMESTPIVGNCANSSDKVRQVYETPNFQPHGLRSLTPFAENSDRPSCQWPAGTWEGMPHHPGQLGPNGVLWEGKVTHPAPGLDNSLLVTFCVGPCRGAGAGLPESDMGIAIVRATPQAEGAPVLEPVQTAGDVEWLHNSPDWHEWYVRVLASYEDIYKQPAPEALPFLPRSPRAEPGDPVGWIGASSTCHADVLTSPLPDRDGGIRHPGAWFHQGIDPPWDCESVVGMRIYALEPTRMDGAGFRWEQLGEFSEERHWILGEVPVESDGSWLAMVPGDIPIAFSPINAAGDALVPPATWKKVAPGEERKDCGGCHAHSKQPIPFAGTAADAAAYSPHDVAYQTPLMEAVGRVLRAERAITVEWVRDVAEHFLAEGESPIAREPWLGVARQIRHLRPDDLKDPVPDSLRSPLVTTEHFRALPEPVQRNVRRWIGMGAPRNLSTFADRPDDRPRDTDGTWFLDEYPPTLAMEAVDGKLFVGAYDLHDTTVVPEVTVEGEALSLMEIQPGRRWVTEAPPAGTLVTVRAQDAAVRTGGVPAPNVRVIRRVLGVTATEPDPDEPPPPEDCPEVTAPECPVHTVRVQCPESDSLECLIER